MQAETNSSNLITLTSFSSAMRYLHNCGFYVQAYQSFFIFMYLSSGNLQGDKNIIKFDGDHNSSRPQSYYDSVLVFFYNVLRPPPISSSYSSKLESYYSLGDVNSATGLDESFLYEIISGLRSACIDVASSSSAPPAPLTTKPTNELLSEAMPMIDTVYLFSFLLEFSSRCLVYPF
jgi:hypothetical protein